MAPNEAALDTFKAGLRGELIGPDDGDYAEARKVYNAMIDRKPRLNVGESHAHDAALALGRAAPARALTHVGSLPVGQNLRELGRVRIEKAEIIEPRNNSGPPPRRAGLIREDEIGVTRDGALIERSGRILRHACGARGI